MKDKENRNLPQVLESAVKIRFHDCDPLGHLNNGRYLDYFLTEREEQIQKHYGLDLREIGRQGKAWVIRNSAVSYLIPALYGDTVIIQTSILNCTKSSAVIEAVMRDETKDQIHAGAWLQAVFFDTSKGRPARHDEHMMQLFENASLNIDFSFDSIKERINSLRKNTMDQK